MLSVNLSIFHQNIYFKKTSMLLEWNICYTYKTFLSSHLPEKSTASGVVIGHLCTGVLTITKTTLVVNRCSFLAPMVFLCAEMRHFVPETLSVTCLAWLTQYKLLKRSDQFFNLRCRWRTASRLSSVFVSIVGIQCYLAWFPLTYELTLELVSQVEHQSNIWSHNVSVWLILVCPTSQKCYISSSLHAG